MIMKSSITTVFNSSSSFLLFIFVSCYSLLLLSSHSVVVSFSLSSEGEALLSLVNSFSSVPDSIKLSWYNLSSSTPCNWSGIGCNTEKTHVVSLDLNGYEITGQLGPQIGQLSYLKSLNLGFNHFNGSIPIEFWNCSHLQHLDLSNNEFTGVLPEAVSNLNQLNSLDISINPFSGRIPESLFQISGLEYVYLFGNNFTGSIPLNIANATNMKYLLLQGSSLHGTIPTSIANCTKLEFLSLSDNGGLSGEIPLGVWRIPTLATIKVSDNNLSGELPVEMTKLHHLRAIYLDNNQFSGLIPEALGINSTSLEWVDLSDNHFSGEIPWSICYLSFLEKLDLSDNMMNGTLPQCLGDSNKLYTLILRNNYFTGNIPPNFTSNQLVMLDLNGNQFEGKLPRIHSPKLRYLDLGNNQLKDTFPFFLGEILSDLEILVLRSNKLYGHLKRLHSNSTFSKLIVLDISSNYFTGDLPLEFGFGLEAMKQVHYSDNQKLIFDSRISTVVIHKGIEMRLNRTVMAIFRAIDMSNNRFQGTIPKSLGELVDLTMLNLSNNNFNGRIPSSMGKLKQLESLDLSQNDLFGEIPSQLTKLNSLSVLNLSRNYLTGSIPTGGQFITFTNDSFLENPGLCGLQISSGCGYEVTFPGDYFIGNP